MILKPKSKEWCYGGGAKYQSTKKTCSWFFHQRLDVSNEKHSDLEQLPKEL